MEATAGEQRRIVEEGVDHARKMALHYVKKTNEKHYKKVNNDETFLMKQS